VLPGLSGESFFRNRDGALLVDSAHGWRKVAEQLEVQSVPGDLTRISRRPYVDGCRTNEGLS